MNYVPFVYLLRFKPTGQFYIGSRYTEKQNPPAHPDQLWTSYFTNSKPVKERIEEFGKESFEYEIRKTFQTSAEARRYENRFLVKVNAAKNPRFLNKHNGGDGFFGGPKSEEYKLNMSKVKLNTPDNVKEKISSTLTGRSLSIKHKENISIGKRGLPGRKWSEEEKARYALLRQGTYPPMPTRVKENLIKINTGSKRTEEQRSTMSSASKGKPKSQQHRLNIGIAVRELGPKGPMSEETKKKIGKANKERPHNKASEETKSKMILSHLARNSGKRVFTWTILRLIPKESSI